MASPGRTDGKAALKFYRIKIHAAVALGKHAGFGLPRRFKAVTL
jgi:hypothetical protein